VKREAQDLEHVYARPNRRMDRLSDQRRVRIEALKRRSRGRKTARRKVQKPLLLRWKRSRNLGMSNQVRLRRKKKRVPLMLHLPQFLLLHRLLQLLRRSKKKNHLARKVTIVIVKKTAMRMKRIAARMRKRGKIETRPVNDRKPLNEFRLVLLKM
jgi:hypothetical protein